MKTLVETRIRSTDANTIRICGCVKFVKEKNGQLIHQISRICRVRKKVILLLDQQSKEITFIFLLYVFKLHF